MPDYRRFLTPIFLVLLLCQSAIADDYAVRWATKTPIAVVTPVSGDTTYIRLDGLNTATKFNTPYAQTVTVAKSGGDYTTITAALAAITDAATGKRYLIKVMPGTYTEAATLVLKSYVDIEGSGWWNTNITISNSVLATLISYVKLSKIHWNIAQTVAARNILDSSATLRDVYIADNKFSYTGNFNGYCIDLRKNGSGGYTDIYIDNNIFRGTSASYNVGLRLGNYCTDFIRVFVTNNNFNDIQNGILIYGDTVTSTGQYVTPILKNNYFYLGAACVTLRLSADNKYVSVWSYNNTYALGIIDISAAATRTATFNSYGDTLPSVTKAGSGGTETFNSYGSTIGGVFTVDDGGAADITTTGTLGAGSTTVTGGSLFGLNVIPPPNFASTDQIFKPVIQWSPLTLFETTISATEAIECGMIKASTAYNSSVFYNGVGVTYDGTIFGGGVSGDTYRRVTIRADGHISYGSGAAVRDIILGRDNTNVFRVGDTGYTAGRGFYFDCLGGRLGVGFQTPTAVLHLKAGTATAGTAPLKFTTGTLLTTPEAGTIEYLSSKFYIRGTEGLAFGAATEYINSTNAGYLDLFAGTAIRLNDDTSFLTNKAYFRDSALYIYSASDSQLNLVADGSVEVNAPILNVTSFYSAGTVTGSDFIIGATSIVNWDRGVDGQSYPYITPSAAVSTAYIAISNTLRLGTDDAWVPDAGGVNCKAELGTLTFEGHWPALRLNNYWNPSAADHKYIVDGTAYHIQGNFGGYGSYYGSTAMSFSYTAYGLAGDTVEDVMGTKYLKDAMYIHGDLEGMVEIFKGLKLPDYTAMVSPCPGQLGYDYVSDNVYVYKGGISPGWYLII